MIYLIIGIALAATVVGIAFAHVRSRRLEDERRERDRLRIERLARVHARPIVTPHFDPPPVMATRKPHLVSSRPRPMPPTGQ